jgi:hypothetical protein
MMANRMMNEILTTIATMMYRNQKFQESLNFQLLPLPLLLLLQLVIPEGYLIHQYTLSTTHINLNNSNQKEQIWQHQDQLKTQPSFKSSPKLVLIGVGTVVPLKVSIGGPDHGANAPFASKILFSFSKTKLIH